MANACLRRAGPGDQARVLEFIAAYYHHDGIPFEREIVGAGLRALLQEPTLGTAYFIQEGAAVAGYLIATKGFDLEYGGRFWLVTDFFLEPAQRGRGLGTCALRELEKSAREQGLAALLLQPERANTAAVEFYMRNGFQSQDRIPLQKRL